MVVILVTGLYLAGDRWDFGDFFVSWGFVAILALFGLVHGYFGPRERRHGRDSRGGGGSGPGRIHRST